ncbi:MAG: hypothetical protein OEM24_01975 [Paracoccaceae bacterium]|nr:hypothetical protein [Paracoccaceae bacterium]
MTGFLRPEALAALARWREVAGALVFAAFGLWVATFGGWFFQGVGLILALAGLWGAVIAFRRMQFRRAVEQPGIVEVDEGQVRYLGPHGGGFAALPEVVELELLSDLSGRRWWRLREAGGNHLAVPVAAEGADQLFDAFARLPGLSPAALLAALDDPQSKAVTVWRRAARRALT